VFVPPPDRSLGEEEWRPFVEDQAFGHLIAPGTGPYPVVAPTQFSLEADHLVCHFAAANPILEALRAEPRAVMSVAGDWAFIPSSWKAVGDEDPLLGIPTTYYAAVQIRGTARVVDEPAEVAELLRRQLRVLQPDTDVADPLEAHPARLRSIRGVVLDLGEVEAKFKYGGNVDADHRRAVVARLHERGGPGDEAAAAHTLRRMGPRD
jgi:transcriptional regulator